MVCSSTDNIKNTFEIFVEDEPYKTCSDGKTYTKEQECDGKDHCSKREDEKNCRASRSKIKE